LGPHLGPVLYQLPPHWRCNLERLRAFLALLPPDVRHAIEFRDASWYNEDVRAALTEAGAGFCIHDLRGAPCPLWVTARFVYLRSHGPTQKAYGGRYDRRHLRRWSERIDGFRRSGHDVYAYFNNDQAGYAVTNARDLQELQGTAPALTNV